MSSHEKLIEDYIPDDKKDEFNLTTSFEKRKNKDQLLNGNPHYHTNEKVRIITLAEDELVATFENTALEDNAELPEIVTNIDETLLIEDGVHIPTPIGVKVDEFEGAAHVQPVFELN